jgi:hypothetical protein
MPVRKWEEVQEVLYEKTRRLTRDWWRSPKSNAIGTLNIRIGENIAGSFQWERFLRKSHLGKESQRWHVILPEKSETA